MCTSTGYTYLMTTSSAGRKRRLRWSCFISVFLRPKVVLSTPKIAHARSYKRKSYLTNVNMANIGKIISGTTP